MTNKCLWTFSFSEFIAPCCGFGDAALADDEETFTTDDDDDDEDEDEDDDEDVMGLFGVQYLLSLVCCVNEAVVCCCWFRLTSSLM